MYVSIQKQPGCKKRCGPVQNDQCEKSCEIKGGPRNGCDGKNCNNNNSGEFCAEAGMRKRKFT